MRQIPQMPATIAQFGTALSRSQRIRQHLAGTETPAFQQAYESTYDNARRTVESSIRKGQKGFVVLDIDETTLDNRGFFADPERRYYQKGTGFQSLAEGWQAWVNGSQIPVIPAAKRFIDWLNREQVPYVFLTGIRESLAQGSMRNLQQVGVWGRACLGAFYRPDEFQGNTAAFKSEMRPWLEVAFKQPILATIGDQPGDMTGDSGRDFKLPDYIRPLRRENDAR